MTLLMQEHPASAGPLEAAAIRAATKPVRLVPATCYPHNVTERRARGLRRGLLVVSWVAFVVALVMLISAASSCDPFHCDDPCHDGDCCDNEHKTELSHGEIGFSITVLIGVVGMFVRAFVPKPDKKPRTDQGST
jgi:hypothetical protein